VKVDEHIKQSKRLGRALKIQLQFMLPDKIVDKDLDQETF